MNIILFIIKYLKYRVKAQTKFDIHSPFVYKLTTEVINNKYKNTDFKSIEVLRKELLKNKNMLSFVEMGAGNFNKLTNTKSIANITKNSAKPKKYAQLLFRLVQYFNTINILELGTSLGISTSYMAKANQNANIISIEGNESVSTQAAINFKKLNINNIRLITGNFDVQLPILLEENRYFDLIFFDGNHRKEPTLNYFMKCLKYKTEESVFIFDDIHWSKEMEEAWEIIKQSSEVTVSIDLFFLGLVFFRKASTKEHFSILF